MPEYIRNDEWQDINLDYVGENNFASFFSSDGNLHTYPAKAVPEMANSLLSRLKDIYKVKNVLDPFVGSGTIALEAKYLGLDFYGSDLNPLAVLLAQTKVMTINNTPYVKRRIMQFATDVIKLYSENTPVLIEKFENIDYWFKNDNIRQLSFLKHQINKFLKQSTKYKKEFALIMLTAFSSTIRASSLSRNGEFKLYRMSCNDISKFSVNSLEGFKKKTEDLLEMLVFTNNTYIRDTESEIYLEDAKELAFMENRKVDLIITSPPYGDSKSTVAYGEFSKLSLQWMSDLLLNYLNIETKYDNCDEYLLGGKHSVAAIDNLKENEMVNNSKTLANLFLDIASSVKKETKEIQSIKSTLIDMRTCLVKDRMFETNILSENTMLGTLIRSNIRLHYLKEIKKNIEITEKEAKEKAKQEAEEFINNLKKIGTAEWENNIKLFITLMTRTITTLTKKINFLPKRVKEIEKFFVDLYQVVNKAEEVINEGGIQVWIVGHRTVLGSIEVKLAAILHEWFECMDYNRLALIKRNYHYKRLPHHINSTLTRVKEVKTMNEEHILIVQKRNTK